MAVKVKNETSRRIGVSTPGGIVTIAQGKEQSFDEVANIDALKRAGAKVSGKNKSETEDGDADADADAKAKADADAEDAKKKASAAAAAGGASTGTKSS